MSSAPARRIRRAIAALASLGTLGLGGLFVFLWVEHGREVTLPTPTGPFAVGRVVYDWTDTAAVDSLAPVPGTRRELLVWIWYPAAPKPGQFALVTDQYWPEALKPRTALPRGPLVFSLLTRDLANVHGHSARDAAVSPQRRSYPVTVMRAGASAPVLNYSTIAEDLASNGYVVVGFDAPYRTTTVVFPDGRVIARSPQNNPELVAGEELVRRGNALLRAWTRDVTFVLDRLQQLDAAGSSDPFSGRLDLARVGVFGHSLGGATAAQFCHDDSRCKAAIDIDGRPLGGVVHTGLDKPLMFLLSDHGDFSSDAESRQIKADIQSIYDRLPSDGRVLLAIKGANHFTFSDDGALLKSGVLRGVLRLFGKLGIDGRRQLEVTAHCVRTFFGAYLEHPSGARPTLASPRYPEIQVLE